MRRQPTQATPNAEHPQIISFDPHQLFDTAIDFASGNAHAHTPPNLSAVCNLNDTTYPVAIMQRPFYVAPHCRFNPTVWLTAQNIHSATLKDCTTFSVGP
jgi:hypothetical protein